MSYRHVDTLIGREALVAAHIERSWLWYRITFSQAILAESRTIPIVITYTLTKRAAYDIATRLLSGHNPMYGA